MSSVIISVLNIFVLRLVVRLLTIAFQTANILKDQCSKECPKVKFTTTDDGKVMHLQAQEAVSES